MRFKPRPIQTPYFQHDGRGPALERWVRDHELFFPHPNEGFAPFVGDIVGAHYVITAQGEANAADTAWVIFYGLQVIQIVPEEVHAYWHLEYRNQRAFTTGIWEIAASPWLPTFNPRHLAEMRHFVLEFCDEVVEVICRDLVFGPGRFDIHIVAEADGRFAAAFLRLAEVQERVGQNADAINSYQKYIDRTPDPGSIEYARRRLERLQAE